MPAAVPRRFTYGAQFSPAQTPLPDLLELCEAHRGDRPALQAAIQAAFFSGRGAQGATLAMNCFLSLKAYRIIAQDGPRYENTDLGNALYAVKNDPAALYRKFAAHILLNLEGLHLLRVIENMRSRGEEVGKEAVAHVFNEQGVAVSPNSTYTTTMRSWLEQARVFHGSRNWKINWDVVDGLLGVDADVLSELYKLSVAQKHFLLSMAQLGADDWMLSNRIAEHARSIYRVKITTEQLQKLVVTPLVQIGLVEAQKTTTGRGAKPHEVRFTDKGRIELLVPLLQNLAKVTDLQAVDINQPFEAVVAKLDDPDKNVRGIALELLAVWIIRLLGLRFSRWRVRNYQETGGGEVDVLAASDKIVYSRWQIQCKNTRNAVDTETIAKEIGLTFLTKADIVMVVTTSTFTGAAVDYSNLVTDTSRYYIVLLDGEDIRQIVDDRAKIVDILNAKARRVFARKELGLTEEQPATLNSAAAVQTADDKTLDIEEDEADV